MQLENKKIKVIAEAYDVSEEKVSSILDAYMALTLNNILVHKEDTTMFGIMTVNREEKKLEIIENSDYIDDIFSGNVSPEIFKRFLILGNNKI